MRIGVPTEIKSGERRVGLTPESAAELVAHGHEVLIQSGAGDGIGAADDDYVEGGATIAPDAKTVFGESTMIIKVKEPQAEERAMLTADHVLFTYLHLAPDPDQTADLVASGATCIAYETIVDRARSPAASASRRAPTRWRSPRAAPVCCWAACPVWHRPAPS
jgi:alanine dehydrogenase